MPIGRLVRWKEDRGFGWLKADDAGRDLAAVFVHITEFKRIGIHYPQVDTVLAYRIKPARGKAEAVDLELVAPASRAA